MTPKPDIRKKAPVKSVRLLQALPKRRIENTAELEQGLSALRKAVTDALVEADAVELE